MHDLVIRNGKIYDGTGAAPFEGDVAIDGGVITAVGEVSDKGREEIDAAGRIVTPGFVDAHTHYDGQVTWDPYVQPSTFHGVTTIVTGNCGVGFAPVKADQRDWIIRLMEGVEDIPGTALHEGIQWQWETFPEYLDALDQKPLAIDVGTQVPHGAIRAYVMGERGPAHENATPDEIKAMARIAAEAIEAGALGFSTSRTEKHKDSEGNIAPTITVLEEELVEIAKAVGKTGKGVLQGISDFYDFGEEFRIFKNMVRESGRPISITVEQQDARPEWWQQLLDGITEAQAEGLPMRGQVPPRATGVLQGLTATLNPFLLHPSFLEIAGLSLEEKVAKMRDPAFRAKILAEEPIDMGQPLLDELIKTYAKMFELGTPANYEPAPEDSLEARAKREGRTPQEVAYDLLLEDEGKKLLYFPLFNYGSGNLDFVHKMLTHPYTTFGLSDGGAHCGALCDASFPTTLIQHWGRDRTAGPKLPLEKLISMQTKETAELVGLGDRGILKPGYKADVNVIDFEGLTLYPPTVVYDLPAGGRRLIQKADGYEVTIVNGEVAFRNGEPTGKLNGKLIRGAQPAPQAMAAE
ncbi:MAG: N-acyl-D-amino-acid deacylase family protein [Alphaproteobacteria bacterium]